MKPGMAAWLRNTVTILQKSYLAENSGADRADRLARRAKALSARRAWFFALRKNLRNCQVSALFLAAAGTYTA